MKIAVFCQTSEGKIHPSSYELLRKAREISLEGEKVIAVTTVPEKHDALEELIYRGADEVHAYCSQDFYYPDPNFHAKALIDFSTRSSPDAILIPATPFGRVLAPIVAAKLRTGLTADCIEIRREGEEIIQIRPAFSGNVIAEISTSSRPIMCTIRPKVFPEAERDPSRKGKVLKFYFSPRRTGTRVRRKVAEDKVKISEAEIILSVGRGLKSKKDLGEILELAERIGAKVGASRPLVDSGWIGKEHQVGFSGNVVRPRLYIALGISGSPQHLAGMKDSEVIFAVNKDPSAPIRKYSDYLVLGDMYEFLKKLKKRLEGLKA